MSTVISPYEMLTTTAGQWWRGNLHTHTTESDGAFTPEEVVSDYERRGYHFLAITEHDRLSSRRRQLQSGTKMTLLAGCEVGGGPHILAIAIKGEVKPSSDRQAVINAIIQQGGIAILNHPNWGRHFCHWEQSVLESLQDYVGIEIYNGVVEAEPGNPRAADRWDMLLSAGRRVWGFAHDDFHYPGGMELGWIMVYAPIPPPGGGELERPDQSVLLESIRKGCFYASTGVAIQRISTSSDKMIVETANAQVIRFLGEHGRLVARVAGSSAECQLPETGYLRAECYGSGDAIAWTQPVFCG